MNETAANSEVVSFDDEPLILVDSDDNVIGYKPKGEAHDGEGLLHRAFSVFLFNAKGELLLQQRHPGKRLWGGYWANSCCSHPRRGEGGVEAAKRRTEQELGLSAGLTYLFKFEYHAQFGEIGAEHELCSVYVGRCDDDPTVNVNEIAEWKWILPQALDEDLVAHPERYTPWLKMEWKRLREELWSQVEAAIR